LLPSIFIDYLQSLVSENLFRGVNKGKELVTYGLLESWPRKKAVLQHLTSPLPFPAEPVYRTFLTLSRASCSTSLLSSSGLIHSGLAMADQQSWYKDMKTVAEKNRCTLYQDGAEKGAFYRGGAVHSIRNDYIL